MAEPEPVKKKRPSSGRELLPGEAMLWQAGTSNENPVWIAVTPDGERVKNTEGKYTTRYDKLPGAVYYNPSRVKLDPDAKPEPLPPGWPADSPEGKIVRYCGSPEARKDWAFLDAWKRRRNTTITHPGCGEGQWPEVPQRVPLTCPKCGKLDGEDAVYAQWYTVKDPEGEGVKVMVFEAWLTGNHRKFLSGWRPVPSPGKKVAAPWPAPVDGSPEIELDAEPPSGSRTGLLVGVVLGFVLLAAVAVFTLG